MTGPALPAEARQLAAELELLSHGSTTSWSPSGRSVPDSRIPSGEPWPPHLMFLDEYRNAPGPTSRQQAIRRWRKVLDAHRGHGTLTAPAPGETPEQEEQRMVVVGEGWSVTDVALTFRCTPTRVRRVRLAAGVNVDTGRRPDGQPVSEGVRRAEEAVALTAGGLTQQQVAERMGVSQPTVHRLLKTRRLDTSAA